MTRTQRTQRRNALNKSTVESLTWTVHSFVVVRVDAHVLLFGAKGVLAALQGLQLVVRLQVGPAPHPAINNMRQTFPVGHLQPSVQGAGDCHTVTGLTRAAEGPLQLLHGPLLLFQLLNQSVHGLFRPFLFLVSLLPTQQPLDRRAGEGEERGDVHAVQTGLLSAPLLLFLSQKKCGQRPFGVKKKKRRVFVLLEF